MGFIHLTVFIVMVPGKDEIRKFSHASMLDHGMITFENIICLLEFHYVCRNFSLIARTQGLEVKILNLPHDHK